MIIVYTPNALQFFQKTRKIPSLKELYAIESDEFRVGFVGEVFDRKAKEVITSLIEELFEAWAIIDN